MTSSSRLASPTPMSRLGMRWQITCLLIVTQLAAHVATMVIVSPAIRSDERQQAFALDLADPLLLLLPLLPQDATSSHPVALAMMQSYPHFQLRPTRPPETAPQLELVQSTLNAAVPSAWAGRLLVYAADWSDRRRGPISEPFEVAVDLADGRQLVLDPQIGPFAKAVPPVVLTLGLMLIAMPIMILSVWAGNVIVRPIGQLAAGADAFAKDINAPHIAAGGAPEVRRAARSVNAMRDRIGTLLKDRSLTLAAISHDMRTPLTRMRLRLETFSPEKIDDVRTDLAELERMIDDALRFLRAEEEVANLRRTDLAVLCKTVCDAYADDGAKVRYVGPDHLVSECDPALMRRVLENTVSNAVRHAGAGTVILARCTDPDGAGIKVDVVDRGPGIASDQFETVLKPFSRLDAVKAGRSGSVGGFGLGLAISQQLMARQNGELSLRANEPKGLIVRLRLPAGMPAT